MWPEMPGTRARDRMNRSMVNALWRERRVPGIEAGSMPASEIPLPMLDAIVVRALDEDLGAGDVTTEACVPADQRATAHGVARKEMIVSGVPVAARVFATIDPTVR